MVVVPLVFATLALGVANLGDLSRVGRIGAKTLLFFVLTTAFAAAVGLLLVNLRAPGRGARPGHPQRADDGVQHRRRREGRGLADERLRGA